MKKTISLLLVLVLAVSCLPLAASAAVTEIKNYDSVTHIQQVGGGFISYVKQNDTTLVIQDGVIQSIIGESTLKVGDSVSIGKGGEATYIAAHKHEYEWTVNRDGHFYRCKCGTKHNFAEHFNTGDGKCVCGYTFMDNADLTVLWMSGIKLTPGFKKNVTEYEGKLTRKDQKEIKISAFPFDAKATVELPEDLTLKQGTNVFEIKVTAEDGKTSQTYTVTVENA